MTAIGDFRAAARRWLAGNLDRRDDGAQQAHGDDDYTDEYLSRQRAIQRRLFDGGYAGLTWPREYGGAELTVAHEEAFLEEARGYLLPDFGKSALTTFGVCGPTILAVATEAFKRRHIPRVLAGEELWAQFFSEPSAGSDLAAVKTTAVRDGDGWRINGSKTWSSYAHRCDWGLCLARTDPDAEKHAGLTWFAIPCDAPGLAIRPFKMIDGTSAFCEEFFDDVFVPDSERVGDVDDGWNVTRKMLLFERDSDGIKRRRSLAPGPLDAELVALRDLHALDARHRADQLIVTAHVLEYVVRQLYVRVEDCLEDPRAAPVGVAAFGKLARGTFDPVVARIGMELAGGAATAWRPDDDSRAIGTRYLNGRVYSIAGGTNEMQRNAVAERVHGLPRG